MTVGEEMNLFDGVVQKRKLTSTVTKSHQDNPKKAPQKKDTRTWNANFAK